MVPIEVQRHQHQFTIQDVCDEVFSALQTTAFRFGLLKPVLPNLRIPFDQHPDHAVAEQFRAAVAATVDALNKSFTAAKEIQWPKPTPEK